MSATKRKMTMRESAARAERAAQRPQLRLIYGGLSGKTNTPHPEDFSFVISDADGLYGYAHCPECGELTPLRNRSTAKELDVAVKKHIEECH